MNYTIKYVSTITGLSEHRIRAWEKRYQLLCPDRTDKGRRLYNDQDIEKLNLIGKLIERGSKIGELVHLSLSQLRTEVQGQERHQPKQEKKLEKDELALKHYVLEQSLLSGRFDLLNHELAEHSDISNENFLNQVLIPFYKILIASKNKISGDRLKTVQAILVDKLKKIFYATHNPPLSNKMPVVAIGTTNPDSLELDSWLCALNFQFSGTPVIHLGLIRDAKSLREFAASYRPRKIVLTDQFEGKGKEWRAEESIQKAFSDRPMAEEQNLEILLLLQGITSPNYCPLLSGRARLQAFDSFDSIKRHLHSSSDHGWSLMATSA
jgi:DNA-binding transcriptional MerR regulator